jgi:hypothetical protein
MSPAIRNIHACQHARGNGLGWFAGTAKLFDGESTSVTHAGIVALARGAKCARSPGGATHPSSRGSLQLHFSARGSHPDGCCVGRVTPTPPRVRATAATGDEVRVTGAEWALCGQCVLVAARYLADLAPSRFRIE